MPGKGIVAATDETLTIAPPTPAEPPGRMARKACLRPRPTPTTLTSSMRRRSAGSRSITSADISMPALLTRMSKPARSATVLETAASQLASSVTSSVTKAAVAPDSRMDAAVCWPSSARMSPIMIDAPARASASAMPAPSPRAPPVTSALRPVRSYAVIRRLLGLSWLWPMSSLILAMADLASALSLEKGRRTARCSPPPQRPRPPQVSLVPITGKGKSGHWRTLT